MVDIKKYGIEPCGAVPSEIQLNHFRLSKKAFFHFGVNTFTDNEWGNGTEVEKIFAPTELDTDQWIRTAKEAGFTLAIITAKHHDGFCLWPSKYTEHSVKNSPYKDGKGDVIREFTDSCRKYGIKAGVYISPWDRNSPLWGKDEYSDYYAKQLTELMTEYGELYEVWWDGAGSTETRYDWSLWESIVRKYQPNAAIFGSLGAAEYVDIRWVGNEKGFAGETHYASIDPKYLLNETPAVLNVGDINGRKFIPSETDVSIRPGWFYHASQDDAVKSVSQLNKIWFESVGRNSMLLLNFPPDRRGQICDTDAVNAIKSNECIKKMLAKNYVNDAEILWGDVYVAPIVVSDSASGIYHRIYDTDRLDIILPMPTKFNVFAFSELIEGGERVKAFKLENVFDDGTCETLYEGTSVGFYRAILIKEGSYRHLRLTVTDSLDKPLLMNFGLHYFRETPETLDNAESKIIPFTSTENENDVIVNFGGIYSFNHIEFNINPGTDFKIAVFNGSQNSKMMTSFSFKI